MLIQANELSYRDINECLRSGGRDSTLMGCLGQRFIGAGMSGLSVTVEGIPGNALGAYLTGASITVRGNAQDAVGDTMNDGEITIHGSVGDAAGYAMRGGSIFIQGDAGYRTGIHMKEYREKVPLIVIGGTTGSFLGEYQAGGVIVVLGLCRGKRRIVGQFPCTGMHGGKLILRSDGSDLTFPGQVTARSADAGDLEQIEKYVREYCSRFGTDVEVVMNHPFTVVTPDSRNPYKQLYVAN